MRIFKKDPVYPTFVGMSRWKTRRKAIICSLSHACGSESDYKHHILEYEVVYPTRVGMSRDRPVYVNENHGLSHVSGNKSPSMIQCEQLATVYPTQVGMSRFCILCISLRICLSHACGNDSKIIRALANANLFVPHAWEWFELLMDVCMTWIVRPTCVGMVRVILMSPLADNCSSHMRGNGSHKTREHCSPNTFIPHVWE